MVKRVFTFFDMGNEADPRTVAIKNEVEKIIKNATGITDIRMVEDLAVVFDAFENLNIIDKANFVHYMLEFYYEIEDYSAFGNEIQKGLARQTFEDARDIIFVCIDDIEENILVPYNDEVDIFISYFKEDI